MESIDGVQRERDDRAGLLKALEEFCAHLADPSLSANEIALGAQRRMEKVSLRWARYRPDVQPGT